MVVAITRLNFNFNFLKWLDISSMSEVKVSLTLDDGAGVKGKKQEC